jgi:uncharacterized membrane protein HdeD (DUF308 family)
VERIGQGIDRSGAKQRVADYLRREQGIGDADAERRADDIVGLLGSSVAAATGEVGALVDNWWLFALRGVLALLFGLFAVFSPVAALVTFVLIFGVWAFIDGIHALALALTGWRSWQLVLVGLVGIAVGLFTFFRPDITAIGLYAAIAAWSIARGVLEIVVAIQLRKEITGEVWMVLAAIVSIVFGVLMVALPAAGALALGWLIGVYALTVGVMLLVLSGRLYRLRHPARQPEPRAIDMTRRQPA